MTFQTKEQVADHAWAQLERVREESLAIAILDAMTAHGLTPPAPTPEQTADFLEELTRIAWKTGFLDAMNAIESGAVSITPITNN